MRSKPLLNRIWIVIISNMSQDISQRTTDINEIAVLDRSSKNSIQFWMANLLTNQKAGFEIWKYGMVFCYQNFSDLLWEKNVLLIKKIPKFETEGWEFAKCLGSLEQFTLTIRGHNNFW